MKTVILLPTTGKLKTQISLWGNSWLVIMKMNDVPCLDGEKGFLVCPTKGESGLGHPAVRWIRESDCNA